MKTRPGSFKISYGLGLATGLFCFTCLGQVDRPVQRTFASPSDAKNALIEAARAHDQNALNQILGPETPDLMTGDNALDAKHLDAFATELEQRCDLVPQGNGRVVLNIGQNAEPFDIPLIQTNGAWMFDTAAGSEQVINRHIGRCEYHAIGACRDYVNAQRDYGSRFRSADGSLVYAMRLSCSPGKMDGLSWPPTTSAASCCISPHVAEASVENHNGGRGPRPYYGYCFKILTRQGPDAPGGKRNYVSNGGLTGGFALVAYPVRWGRSGIMTFIVNQNGVVYQRNLGEKTQHAVSNMRAYNPDRNWTVVREQGTPDVAEGGIKN